MNARGETLSPRVSGPLKPEALSTDLCNAFSHSFSPSAFIGRLLYTSPALGPGDMAANKPNSSPAGAHIFQRWKLQRSKGLVPAKLPLPATCLWLSPSPQVPDLSSSPP